MIPDNPLIRCAEETGYAPWNQPEYPICPVCGSECERIYKDQNGDIVGCDECLTESDAHDEDACFSRRDE